MSKTTTNWLIILGVAGLAYWLFEYYFPSLANQAAENEGNNLVNGATAGLAAGLATAFLIVP